MSSSKRSFNWFIAGLLSFIVMMVCGTEWLVNVFINKVINGLCGGNVHLDLGILNTISHYAMIVAILVAAWCFVATTLKKKPVFVVLFLVFAILVVLGMLGIAGFSIIH